MINEIRRGFFPFFREESSADFLVYVYRGYQLNITFKFDLTPYIEGDDAAAC